MNKYEIINPSDKAYIHAEDFKTASVSILVALGSQYGLKERESEEAEELPPLFNLRGGGNFVNQFFEEKFGKTFREVYEETDTEDIVKCLKSAELAGDRTSLNNFTKGCQEVAETIEDMSSREEVDEYFEEKIQNYMELHKDIEFKEGVVQ